ncbi:MAG: galactokinase [Desulfobacteraceae bacterium]|nr:galactokinase [Desulfobacteraceae bacterium]
MINLDEVLEKKKICASAPCRIDFAGTLDINTFSFPMADLCPVTFNMAIDLRTKVSLLPYERDYIKVSSKGFQDACFESKKAPYDHELGLVFAICDAFDCAGIEVIIESSSPPRSALGGSSVFAVALVSVFMKILNGERVIAKDAALRAHLIESAVAGVPCGLQDHLCAAYGGANAWHWTDVWSWPDVTNTTLLRKNEFENAGKHFLVAYTGKTHDSHSVNTRWREQFVSGKHRNLWNEIALLSHEFCLCFAEKDFSGLGTIVNREVELRLEMTPDVLDNSGRLLYELARKNNCGARFTGAGAGGCMWAVGSEENIKKLESLWRKELSKIKDAMILDTNPEPDGILFEEIHY